MDELSSYLYDQHIRSVNVSTNTPLYQSPTGASPQNPILITGTALVGSGSNSYPITAYGSNYGILLNYGYTFENGIITAQATCTWAAAASAQIYLPVINPVLLTNQNQYLTDLPLSFWLWNTGASPAQFEIVNTGFNSFSPIQVSWQVIGW